MTTNLSIVLKKASKIYHEGDTVSGVAVVESSCDLRHEGLTLAMEGIVNLQLSTKNVGIFEAFSNSIKPITLLSTSIELASAGKIPAGVTEIPFEMPLRARQATSPGYPGLLETYHGVFVNIMYTLKCSMRRSFLNKPLHASCQFFVQHPQQEPAPLKPVRCEITPATVRAPPGAGAGAGAVPRAAMPQFQVYAEIDSTVCALDRPLTGKIRVDECSVPIKSIELQLVRVETCGCAEGYSKDATEIQNIQVGDGDVSRARDLPLHMVLPRLFTCPTTTTSYFKIGQNVGIDGAAPVVIVTGAGRPRRGPLGPATFSDEAVLGGLEGRGGRREPSTCAVDTSTFTAEHRHQHEPTCTNVVTESAGCSPACPEDNFTNHPSQGLDSHPPI